MKSTELVNRFFDAQNQRDRAACSGLMHPEIMWFLHGEATHTPIAGREDCPVSYTHLDVYKRQVVALVHPVFPRSLIGLLLVGHIQHHADAAGGLPENLKHIVALSGGELQIQPARARGRASALDVYKRQILYSPSLTCG